MSVWEQLATDQTDPWQVVPRHVFTAYYCLLIPVAFIVVGHIGCLEVTCVRWRGGATLHRNNFFNGSEVLMNS